MFVLSLTNPCGVVLGRSRASSAKALPDGYKKGDPITCDKCDKTYMHIKDLQIHKNYCFGGS